MSAVVRAAGLAAGYDGTPALAGVTFELTAGERLAVLGPNGGGKTTLFRTILGELTPLRGTLEVAVRASSVPQTDRSRLDYPVSALDVVLMGTLPLRPWWRRAGREHRTAARRALAQVGLEGLAGETFGELSGGQRQRVLVARALVGDAGLLLLDEPFNGLDAAAAADLEELLVELAGGGHAIVLATHDLEQARSWDRVLCLNREQVAWGAPGDVLTPDALARTYGGELVRVDESSSLAVVPPHHHEH